jgi:hypothetical protein
VTGLALLATLLIHSPDILAQRQANDQSSLNGLVSEPTGIAAAGAPIQITNKTTGVVVRTMSEPDGRYVFNGLPAGSWFFSIVMPGFAFERINREIVLEAGKILILNIGLTETVNGSTLGDDPARLAQVLLKRARVPARPAPHDATGRPDLSGVWLVTDDPYPEQPEVLPWAASLIRERRQNLMKDAPHNHCLPGAPPLPASTAPFIARFVQTTSLMVILFEDSPGFRQVFLDGMDRSQRSDPTWMGISIGKWAGDSLVVETVGFNDRSWIGAAGGGVIPHTEMLRMTERYKRVDFGHMELRVTFEDPGALTKPFHLNLKLDLAPQEEVLEYVCENNKPEHLAGK